MNIPEITASTLKEWMDLNEVFLIDVREPNEFHSAYINGAINIPLSKLLIEIHNYIIPANAKIVLQCAAGVRSLYGCQTLAAIGSSFQLYNLKGGIIEWHGLGFPLIIPSKKLL